MQSYPDSGPGVYARVLLFDDYVVVLGSLSRSGQERLSLTHVEYGPSPLGGNVWWPKVADVEADHAA